jgi:hypothetical protein
MPLQAKLFNGREPLEYALELNTEDRKLWLARRLEAYRDVSVTYAATLVRERGDKKTVAEAEAQAVIETDAFTKAVAIEAPVYPLLFGGDAINVVEEARG